MLKEEQGRGRTRRDGSGWWPHECLREERAATPAATWVPEGGEAAAEGGAGDALQQNPPSPAAPAPADQ